MAQQKYSLDMQDTVYPLLSTQQTRTIIGGAIGQSPSATTKPGVAYMHNVMPTRYGMNSVGYREILPAFPDPTGQILFEDVRVIFGDQGTRYYVAFTNLAQLFRVNDTGDAWIAMQSNIFGNTSGNDITTAVVNGVTYVGNSNIAIYAYNEVLGRFLAITASGLDMSQVLGVVASSGYLIAYTKDALAWSSTIDPTDFAPSQITGAGGGKVAGTDGDILFATSNSLGILIYTFNNVIAGTYTGNPLYPFKFREVDGSKGGLTLDTVAYEANATNQFVYSKAGLQSVSSQKAENLLPEITDFLSGRVFEDFNEATKLIATTYLTVSEQLVKKVKYVASRYLIISYGLPTTGFTHALVIDTAMNKVGKLRADHVDVFEYVGDQASVTEESIALVQANGVTSVVDFSTLAASTGVLVMGKLQATLSRHLGLMGVQVENVLTGAALEVLSSSSLDGKNFTNVPSYLADEASNVRDYLFRSSALTHNITLIGTFNLVTLLVAFRVEGKR